MDKIKNLSLKKRIKVSLIVVLIIASLSGEVAAVMIVMTDSKYSNALVENGFV